MAVVAFLAVLVFGLAASQPVPVVIWHGMGKSEKLRNVSFCCHSVETNLSVWLWQITYRFFFSKDCLLLPTPRRNGVLYLVGVRRSVWGGKEVIEISWRKDWPKNRKYWDTSSAAGGVYRRRLGSLLCLCDVFRALVNSLVCWFCKSWPREINPVICLDCHIEPRLVNL